ncbi:MAG: M81 family metallopeptidase, partial [Rhodospirillales bacterium]
MRIGLIHVAQETNDFNPLPTTLRDYESFGPHLGAEVIAKSGGLGQVAGHLKAIADSGLAVETVPIVRAHAVAGGRIDTESREYFLRVIRDGLAAAGRLDGLVLQFHGACAAEGLDDVEGEQAALCREVLGPDVPILLALDHHASVTRRMVDSVTAIVGHRTQP